MFLRPTYALRICPLLRCRFEASRPLFPAFVIRVVRGDPIRCKGFLCGGYIDFSIAKSSPIGNGPNPAQCRVALIG